MTDEQPGRKQRVVLCRGQYCNMDGRADRLYKRLSVLVDEINGDAYPRPLKLEIANCLSLCGAGPNLIAYPDDVTYNGVTEAMLVQIVDEHLRSLRAD
jgi:(2Fe-2S) ferredoxin